MRLKLDDNERGAFNYLIGGALIVLVLRGCAWLFESFGPALSPDGMALRLFQHGYVCLRGELAVADASTGLSERIILAVVLAVGVAFILAFLFAAVARSRRRRAGCAGLWMTRFALAVSLAWSLYAAFFLPLKETHITDGTMHLVRRPPIVGDIPWPFLAKEEQLDRHDIERVEAVEHAPEKGCDGSVELDVVTSKGRERVAWITGICPEERMSALTAGSNASSQLERELR